MTYGFHGQLKQSIKFYRRRKNSFFWHFFRTKTFSQMEMIWRLRN